MKNKDKKVLMITYSTPDKLARLRRCLGVLIAQGYLVDVLCVTEVKFPGVNQVFYFDKPDLSFIARVTRKIARVLRPMITVPAIKHRLTDFMLQHNRCLDGLVDKYDILLVEHVDFLRTVIEKKRKDAKVVFDNKDYFPREFELEWKFRFFDAGYCKLIFRKYLPQVDAIISVSEGLKKLLKDEYGQDSIVIPNAPYFQQMEPTPVSEKLRVVHHGTTHSDRGLEDLILCKEFKESCTLDLYVLDIDNKLEAIKKKAESNSNIRFREPVPLAQLMKTLNQYDVIVIFFPDGTVNNLYGLPNKFFEAIQSRLMIIVNFLPDMAAIVKENDLGVVLPNYSVKALEDCISKLTPEVVQRHKQAAHLAAKKLSFDLLEPKLVEMFAQF